MKAHCPHDEATFERQRHTDRTIPNVSRPTDFVFSVSRPKEFILSPKYTDVGKFYAKARQNLP